MEQLNRNELETMRILWEKGPLKPAELETEFSWPIENATLRSVLRVLMDKGHVKRRRKGKAFYYQARSSRKGLLTSFARQMAHVFADGSGADLIVQLIKAERLSREEIAELQRIAGNLASESSPQDEGKGQR